MELLDWLLPPSTHPYRSLPQDLLVDQSHEVQRELYTESAVKLLKLVVCHRTHYLAPLSPLLLLQIIPRLGLQTFASSSLAVELLLSVASFVAMLVRDNFQEEPVDMLLPKPNMLSNIWCSLFRFCQRVHLLYDF